MTALNLMIHHQPCSNHYLRHTKHNLLISPKYPTLLPFKNISTTRNKQYRFVPCGVQKPSDDGPRKASEELFSLMKNHNLQEFLGAIENEFQIFRYVPFNLVLQSLIRKQGALILSSLIAFITNHFEFVAKPTTEGGADIGFRWNFGWGSNHIPVGPVCSINTTHMYTGKILLRNGKAFIEPVLLHFGPLEKKMKEILATILDKVIPDSVLGGKKRDALLNCLLALIVMAITLSLWKNTFL